MQDTVETGSATLPSFRPAPVLTVAVAGHHALAPEAASRIGRAAEPLFAALAAEAARVAALHAEFFDGTPPRLRAVSRFAGGADLAIMAAAERAGCELRAVLPWRRGGGGLPRHPESLTENRIPPLRHAEERSKSASRSTRNACASFETPAERAPQSLTGDKNPYVPHAEVAAGGGPRSTQERCASFEAPLRGAPQDEDVGSFESGSQNDAVGSFEPGSGENARMVGDATSHLLPHAPQPLDLGGEPGDEGMRAEAGQALLERADILLAYWDGKADAARGSTADLVQQAVRRDMPVLLLPTGEEGEVEIVDDPENHLLPALATELPRVPLAQNLDRVVARAFAPPANEGERQALRECLAEPPAPRSRRPEYRILLTIAARRRQAGTALSSPEEWARARGVAALVSPEAAEQVARAERLAQRMESLAAFYGERARSGTVLRYGMPVVGGVFIALLAVLLPEYSLAWLGVQAVVMTLLVTESEWATRRRWSERWLDYRSLAERLRCDRFLHPCGIGSRRIEDETGAEDPAWMRWCHRRLLAGHWAGGTVTPSVVEAAMRHLAETEIPGQVRYHDGAAIRFRSLGKRLRIIATTSALGMLVASLVLLAVPKGGTWMTVAVNLLTSLLIVLPSLFLASRGLRAEGGFELAAARSAEAAATLRRLAQRIEAAPPSYGSLVQASLVAARAMILDTVDWRVGLQRSRSPYRAPSQEGAPPTLPPLAEGRAESLRNSAVAELRSSR